MPEGELVLRTTPGSRAIGRALHHAYQGELEEPAPQTEGVIRIRWTRD
jgi:hypothetical protein